VIAAAAVCFAVALAATPAVTSVLRRAGALDVPVDRSSHVEPTPRGGGIAVLAGWATGAVTVVASTDGASDGFWTVFVVGCALAVVGLVDDLRGGAPALLRLLVTACVAGVAVAAIGTGEHGAAAALALGVLATIWITGYTNAFNFMDGVNGIAGLTGAVTAVALALAAHRVDADAVAAGAAGLAGALVGFVVWNLAGRVFLGDVGSYAVGAALATAAVVVIGEGAPPDRCLGAFLPYVADTGCTLLRRMARRERLFDAHRDHAYQHLVARGFGHATVAAAVAALSAACAALTWAASEATGAGRLALDAAAVGVAAAYAVAVPRVASRRVTSQLAPEP
jgi:UDP-N-acetylmuramyl pentapeptide phosphotransferase/UDP-N-acetylglucosamine-1-phosphate transferase